jgi:hypothetical protein
MLSLIKAGAQSVSQPSGPGSKPDDTATITTNRDKSSGLHPSRVGSSAIEAASASLLPRGCCRTGTKVPTLALLLDPVEKLNRQQAR